MRAGHMLPVTLILHVCRRRQRPAMLSSLPPSNSQDRAAASRREMHLHPPTRSTSLTLPCSSSYKQASLPSSYSSFRQPHRQAHRHTHRQSCNQPHRLLYSRSQLLSGDHTTTGSQRGKQRQKAAGEVAARLKMHGELAC